MKSIGKPFDFLEYCVSKPIYVFHRNGAVFQGILQSWDIHTNVTLKDVKRDEKSFTDSLFIRGENVDLICHEDL